MSDSQLRRALLEFEIGLDATAADEVRREVWGRALLSPSLPLIWDASYLALERTGLAMASVEALANRVLGGAGFAHRTVIVIDEADGRRLAEEAEAVAGWVAERTRLMAWRGEESPKPPDQAGVRTYPPISRQTANAGDVEGGEAAPGVREASGATAPSLRRRLMLESMAAAEPDPEATAEQLLELDRRLGEAGGDRWFVAPHDADEDRGAPDDDPGAATCRLLRDGRGIGQVEDVATLESARRQGLATAVVVAALAASRAAGDTTTFITADAADWPQFLYEKLGFVPVGTIHVLRRPPT